MTTPYSISVSKGSQTFQGYVNAPITGPLDSSQYPYSMPYHSYGILTGQKPTPPQFYPGQEPVNSAMNTNARAQYLRTTSISSQEKAKHSNGRPMKGIKKRISGKEGQMRNNCMGKRVNQSGRTVIGPDPTLRLDEMIVPLESIVVLPQN